MEPTHLEKARLYNERCDGVSLLVMEEGNIILEDDPTWCHPNAGSEKALGIASGTKTFNGPMAALMAADGLIDPQRKYADPFEEPVPRTN